MAPAKSTAAPATVYSRWLWARYLPGDVHRWSGGLHIRSPHALRMAFPGYPLSIAARHWQL